jgi:hypothetical protein
MQKTLGRLFVSLTGLIFLFWAVASLLSLASDLRLFLDTLNWSNESLTDTPKVIALKIGRYISDLVQNYRVFIHELGRLLHLPPQFAEWADLVGVMVFTLFRGAYLSLSVAIRREREIEEALVAWRGGTPLELPELRATSLTFNFGIDRLVVVMLVYSGWIAVTLDVLFGIDYIYRHYL